MEVARLLANQLRAKNRKLTGSELMTLQTSISPF